MLDAVYCRQVTGFINKTDAHMVWLLNKSLYGTRQAARQWQQHFGKTVLKFGLKATLSDEAVNIMKDKRGLLIIHLHVYDSLIFCDNETLLESFKTFIHNSYELKWTNTPSLYLGIKIDILKDSILISQPQYIEDILDRFAMTNCESANASLPSKCDFKPGNEDEIRAAQDLPFQQLVGFLQWLSHTTRPDISYAVTQISRFNGAWTITHWTMAKPILQYLKGTSTTGIHYSTCEFNPTIFTDSNFSQCSSSITQRSVTGYVATAASGLVSWKSRWKQVVALSKTEAEYMAACEGAKFASWIRSFLFDIFQQVEGAIPFFIDNTSAIDIATGDGIKAKSKHIDRRFHYLRDQINLGLLHVQYISTVDMKADFLTKS